MSKTLRLILGDQLSRSLSSLGDIDRESDTVLMCEVMGELTYVRHHKKKVAFILSAMRHFADTLCEQGISVDYVTLDDPENSGNFTGEVARAVTRLMPHVSCYGTWRVRVLEDMQNWRRILALRLRFGRMITLPTRNVRKLGCRSQTTARFLSGDASAP